MKVDGINFNLIALLFVCCMYGIAVENASNIKAESLFIGLHIAGLGAMFVLTLSNLKNLLMLKKPGFYIVLQFLAFRVAYFPIMVLAATVACYSEWLLTVAGVDWPIKIFPAFFVSVSIFFAALSYLIILALKGVRVAFFILFLIGFPALLISFSSVEDFTLLPDTNWSYTQNIAEVTEPQNNPYIAGVKHLQINPAKKMIALAGASLYPLIPVSPWAQASKGTLEHAYKLNPDGSSQDRLKDHYAAFIIAFKQTY